MDVKSLSYVLHEIERSNPRGGIHYRRYVEKAANVLRDVIKQAQKQEPVGEIVQDFADFTAIKMPKMPPVGTKLYAAPLQVGWIGLSEQEMDDIWNKFSDEMGYVSIDDADEFFSAVESKLREKNAYGWQSVENVTEYLDDLRGGDGS